MGCNSDYRGFIRMHGYFGNTALSFNNSAWSRWIKFSSEKVYQATYFSKICLTSQLKFMNSTYETKVF